jgi:hypothetical protein
MFYGILKVENSIKSKTILKISEILGKDGGIAQQLNKNTWCTGFL